MSMFAYDESQWVRNKDREGDSCCELVQAAEACRVAISHPGKPRYPGEPGLEELLERAKPFL